MTWQPFDLDVHLTQPPVASCNRCGRLSWSGTDLGTEDRMTQPDGNPCGGMFVYREGRP